MKKIFSLLVICIITFVSAFSISAEDGKVTYSENAGEFVFEPGSDRSLTDLFSNFKDVMPGDTLTQKITVKNDADNEVKVKIYIRSLGAVEGSRDFLSQLTLKVSKSEENQMAYMFDAAASETAQLTDWVYLGTLYSGGEVNLDVHLSVPAELSDEYQNETGYLEWEFMVEEFPVEDTDPESPPTGDNSNVGLWIAIMIVSLAIIFILLTVRKKGIENDKNVTRY